MSGSLRGVAAESPIELADDALEVLGVPDAYQDLVWRGPDLARLIEKLEAALEAQRTRSTQRLLAHHRRRQIEPWLTSVLERELDAAPLYRVIERCLRLARLTADAGDALRFLGD